VDKLEELCKVKKEKITQETERVRDAVTLYQQLEKDIAVEEQEISEKYGAVDENIRKHGENLETAARNAKEEYLKQAREKREEDVKLLEEQKAMVKRNLQEALEMEKAIPGSVNTCEDILAFDFDKLDTKKLPKVPKLQKILPPEFVPNTDLPVKIYDEFGNLAI
jgi:hypothetical protein